MKVTTLDELLEDELKELYSAETQLIEALPKMAKSAESTDLRAAFEAHLDETRQHVERIEEICGDLKIEPHGKECAGMAGLIKEGEEIVQSGAEAQTKQAALIGAAQRAEHYEIAAYGTARAHARQLGYLKAVGLLSQTLQEEKEADAKLTRIAETRVNVKAAMSKEPAEVRK